MRVSTFSTNFPWQGLLVSVVRGNWWALLSQGLWPWACTSWLGVLGLSQVRPGVKNWPVFCLRMLALPLKYFLNFWKFFLCLLVHCGSTLKKKNYFFSFSFEIKRRERGREGWWEGGLRGEKERGGQLLDRRACPQGPVPLLGHVPVSQGSTCFTSFFIIQNKYWCYVLAI